MVIVTLRLIFCSAAGYVFARIVLPLATPFLLGYSLHGDRSLLENSA